MFLREMTAFSSSTLVHTHHHHMFWSTLIFWTFAFNVFVCAITLFVREVGVQDDWSQKVEDLLKKNVECGNTFPRNTFTPFHHPAPGLFFIRWVKSTYTALYFMHKVYLLTSRLLLVIYISLFKWNIFMLAKLESN